MKSLIKNASRHRKSARYFMLALFFISLGAVACQSAPNENVLKISFEDEPIVVTGTIPQLAQMEEISFEDEPMIVTGKLPSLAIHAEISFEDEPLLVMGRIAKCASRISFEDEPIIIYGERQESEDGSKMARAQLASNMRH